MLSRVRNLIPSWRMLVAAAAAALLFPVALIGTGFSVRTAASAWTANRPAHALAAFRSDKELAAFLRDVRKREEKRAPQVMYDMAPAPAAPPPPAMAASQASAPAAPGITNNQEA